LFVDFPLEVYLGSVLERELKMYLKVPVVIVKSSVCKLFEEGDGVLFSTGVASSLIVGSFVYKL
jgi:hypothetical protein